MECRKIAAQTALYALMLSGVAGGQKPADPPLQTEADLTSFSGMEAQGKELLEKAKAGKGSAGMTIANYNGHHTMLTARSVSGGAEQHMHYADFLIVLDGSGTELTGGTVVDLKEGADGENHGTKLDGAASHPLHKGDVLHIPAGVPHQSIEAPGETLIVFVIKVKEPVS